jgi:DNA replication protein DnaC
MNARFIKECLNELDMVRLQEQRALQTRITKICSEIPEIATLRENKIKFASLALKNKIQGSKSALNSAAIDDAFADFTATEQILLVRAGYPANYLTLRYRCLHCQDTGFVGYPVKEKCTCLTQALLKKAYNASDSSILFSQQFNAFDPSVFSDAPQVNGTSQRTRMIQLKTKLENYCEIFPETDQRMLLLSGKTGLGKTFLLHCMANRLIEYRHTVVYYSCYSLLDSFFTLQFNDYASYCDLKQQLTSVDVLILDDLGSETMRNKYTIEDLFYIINTRIQINKHLFISTNLTLTELKQRYTERIVSRLFDRKNALIYLLEGEDIRLSRP